MPAPKISLPVIKRLPRYHRYIHNFQRAKSYHTISSNTLAKRMNLTASQVRQDFNCFGSFGQQGVGYDIDVLAQELDDLLFAGEVLNTILIGAGQLGRAVHNMFARSDVKGFNLQAIFTASPKLTGEPLGKFTILDIAEVESFCKEHSPQIAVLCVSEAGAGKLIPVLSTLGLKGIWNFSQYDIHIPGVIVEHVHLNDQLASLAYRVRHQL